MTKRIKHKKAARVRKTVSIPGETFDLCRPRASLFPDFSKYVSALIEADAAKKGEVAA